MKAFLCAVGATVCALAATTAAGATTGPMMFGVANNAGLSPTSLSSAENVTDSGGGRSATLQVRNVNPSGAYARAFSALNSNAAAPAAWLQNSGGGPAAVFLVGSGKAPFVTNSNAKVDRLNSDLVDGHDSTFFTPLSQFNALTTLLGSVGTINASGNPVQWTRLKGVPVTIADGVDNVGVASVAASAPLASSGGATPTISIAKADATHDGYLAQGDWSAFSGKQSRVTGTCTGTNAIQSVNSDGTVGCGGGGSGWSLTGNAGTSPASNFLGTTDNQPLVLKVNGFQALKLIPGGDSTAPDSPNLVGGYSGNTASATASGETVAGGGSNGSVNAAAGNFSTIGGGRSNTASNAYTMVGGGRTTQRPAATPPSLVAPETQRAAWRPPSLVAPQTPQQLLGCRRWWPRKRS